MSSNKNGSPETKPNVIDDGQESKKKQLEFRSGTQYTWLALKTKLETPKSITSHENEIFVSFGFDHL